MELGLLSTIGYLGNKHIEDNSSEKKHSNYDLDFIHNNNKKEKNNSLIKKIIEKRINDSINPLKSNIINKFKKNLNLINNISINNKIMNNEFYENNVKGLSKSNLFKPFDNTSDKEVIDFNNQFKPLLFDTEGNPQPKNITHKSRDLAKMSSIERSLAIQGGWSAFNNSDLDMTLKVNNPDDLSHNNMVPHFKNNGPMINNYNEQNIANKVELFSGSSKNFNPKKELLQEKFKPMETNITNVRGQENFLDKIEGYYNPSSERRNEQPFEPVKVGPGLKLDPDQTSRPDGGLFEEFRPLPKDVNNLRSADNPKESFKGVVVPGQKGSKTSNIGSVFKRRPDKMKENDSKNNYPSGGAYRKPTKRDKIMMRETNRHKSKYIIGPATFEVNKIISQKDRGEVQKPRGQQLEANEPSNLKFQVNKNNNNTKSYDIPETERDTTQYNEHPQGLNKLEYGTNVYNPKDYPKQTIKQTTLYNPYSGVTMGQTNKVTSFDPSNIARPTTKETTLYGNEQGTMGGNIYRVKSYDPNHEANHTIREITGYNSYDGGFQSAVKNVTSYNPSDLPNPTIRSTSAYSKDGGNIGRGETNKVISYNPNDILRNTTRETTQFNDYQGMASGPVNKTNVYNPNDIPKNTIRETTQFNDYQGMARGTVNKTNVYNPNDIPKNTIREITGYNEYEGNLSGPVNKTQSYDPKQVPNDTIRNITSMNQQQLNTKGEIDKIRTYNPNDIARPTLKEQNLFNKDPTNIESNVNYPHHYNPNDILNPTIRETTMFNNYDGGVVASNNKSTAYNPNDLARATNKEQTVYDDRPGIGRGQTDKPHYYDPNDEAKTTIKQTTLYSDDGNIKSAYNKPHVFDPNDLPATTLKEMLVKQYNLGIAHGTINKATAFNPNDIPADTLKQLLVINNYLSNANRESGTGYLSNKFTAPDTLRQLMNILRSGGLKGYDQPSDYTAEKNMEQDVRREILNESREPTNRNYDKVPTAQNAGIQKLKEQINLTRDPIRNSTNNLGNNYYLPSMNTQNKYYQDENNRLDPEVLTQLIDNPLVNNVVNRN